MAHWPTPTHVPWHGAQLIPGAATNDLVATGNWDFQLPARRGCRLRQCVRLRVFVMSYVMYVIYYILYIIKVLMSCMPMPIYPIDISQFPAWRMALPAALLSCAHHAPRTTAISISGLRDPPHCRSRSCQLSCCCQLPAFCVLRRGKRTRDKRCDMGNQRRQFPCAVVGGA
jgi:hypothetical protein